MVGALAGLAMVLATTTGAGALPTGGGSTLTNRGDDARTGWYPSARAPSPSTVSSSGFGQRFSVHLDGNLLAQPIEDQGVLIAATEGDQISGVDPTTGAVRWQRTVGVPVPSSVLDCPDISPQVGITGTPTVDPVTGVAYLVADTLVGGVPQFQVHGIDPTTGLDVAGFPVTLQGRAANHPAVRFSAAQQYQRPGLLLLDGVVYAAFGSHCDAAPWNGWIVGVTTAGRQTTLWATQSRRAGGGIWQSGLGLSSDGPGSIYASVGNGTPPLATFRSTASFGESIVHLQVKANGALQATDDFSPSSRTKQSKLDYDVGAGGVVVLPDTMGSTSTPHLALAVSKSGDLYLLDRRHLGGVDQGPLGSDGIVDALTLPGRLFASPAVVPGTPNLAVVEGSMGHYGYVAHEASAQPLYGISISSAGGVSRLSTTAATAPIFGFGSGSPVVSSAPGDPSTGIVWVERCAVTAVPCSTASLDAFAVGPAGGTLAELNSWPLPAGSKFATPLITDGEVVVGAGSWLVAFGALPSSTVAGSFAAPGGLIAGTVASGALTITATRPVTLQSVSSSSAEFVPSAATVAALADTTATSFTIPVAVSPGQTAGELTAAITVTTSDGSVVVPVAATSTAPGPLLLNATPSEVLYDYGTCTMVEFGGLAVGTSATRSLPLSNVGASPLVITGLSGVRGPFSVHLPGLVGTTIAPGATLQLPITATGGGAGLRTVEIVITTNDRPLHALLTMSSRRTGPRPHPGT